MTLRKKHIEFIERIRELTSLTYTALAHSAGLADSTLTRFISKPEFKRLSSATLDKIAKVGGFKSYEDYLIKNHLNKETTEEIEFSDMEKFSTYEMVKTLLSKKKMNLRPADISQITDNVLSSARRLNTKYISESLILYVLEQENLIHKKSIN